MFILPIPLNVERVFCPLIPPAMAIPPYYGLFVFKLVNSALLFLPRPYLPPFTLRPCAPLPLEGEYWF